MTSVRDSRCELWPAATLDRWLRGLMAIGDEPGYKVDREIGRTPVPGMFNLHQMFELVEHRFQQHAPTQDHLFV